MKLDLRITGLDQTMARLDAVGKQARYAASRALNTTAYAVNTQIKATMQASFAGGATAYSQRAFAVDKANKATLEATVRLRTDAPGGTGTPYNQALGHLFVGGQRRFKKLEGWLRAHNLMPAGQIAVPGAGLRLDARGNPSPAQLREMLGVLASAHTNLRVYRRSGGGKQAKGIGYFVVLPASTGTQLKPGIYRRIETGSTSAIKPMVLFVRQGSYRKLIDLQRIGNDVASKTFQPAFAREFAAAMATAR